MTTVLHQAQAKELIFAVDPGLTRCGYAIIEAENRQCSLRDIGVWKTSPTQNIAVRLANVYENCSQHIRSMNPDIFVVEDVFAQRNVQTVINTAKTAAICMLAATHADISVYTFTPSEVKASITGYGKANKQQIASMVIRLLQLDEQPTPADATDAAALGLCYAMRGRELKKRLERLMERVQ